MRYFTEFADWRATYILPRQSRSAPLRAERGHLRHFNHETAPDDCGTPSPLAVSGLVLLAPDCESCGSRFPAQAARNPGCATYQ